METDPHFVVWSESDVFKLDKMGRVITETIETNPFGRMPGVLIHREPPAGALLDSTTGDDLVSAHMSAAFINVLLLKETRTVNKQVAFGGDLSTTASGQAQDTGADVMLGDGVTAQTLDRSIDLAQYRETSDHVIERAASNHGIPPSLLRHQGATSGFEIELRRIGLRERRRDQIMVFRPVEHELASIMSEVLALDAGAEMQFSDNGFQVDFGEVETPQDAMAKLLFREKARGMGLINTLDMIMEDNPDLRPADALEKLQFNIDVEVDRNERMRALLAIHGSPTAGIGGPNNRDDEGEPDDDDGGGRVTSRNAAN